MELITVAFTTLDAATRFASRLSDLLAKRGRTTVGVHDSSGRKVAELTEESPEVDVRKALEP